MEVLFARHIDASLTLFFACLCVCPMFVEDILAQSKRWQRPVGPLSLYACGSIKPLPNIYSHTHAPSISGICKSGDILDALAELDRAANRPAACPTTPPTYKGKT